MSGRAIDFEDLVGGEFDFYGVAGQRFNLDGLVYEVIGDDNHEDFDVQQSSDHNGFHAVPIARVVVEKQCFNDDGYELVDLHDGHSWLCFGTEVSSDGYPLFVFDYSPKHDDIT